MQTNKILILLAAVVGTAWLTTWVDDGLGNGWTQIVVRNWEQFGFFNLHGKLVVNPGGFEAVTHPEWYTGHRPASLYAVWLCHRLFGSGGPGFLVYYAAMAALVAGSVWVLLGRTERAYWLAVTLVLTPGYVRWLTTLDPNLTAVLFGFPFCAVVIARLSRPALTRANGVGLFLLILVFTALNWTTIFVHAMLFVTLLLLPRVSWRHLVIYAVLTGGLVGGVVLTSLASKMGSAQGSGAGLATILSGYGWGNTGYGVDLTTRTACTRLLAANLLGLMPLLIFLGWQFRRPAVRQSGQGLLFLLPALVPVVEVLGMRNYFGHHPWMSIHFIILGIILAAVVWNARAAAPAAPVAEPRRRLPFRLGWLAMTFTYGFIVLAATHAHNEPLLRLQALIAENTARHTTIVIRQDTDPALAGMAARLPETFDRHLVVLPDASPAAWAAIPPPRIMLTAVPPPADAIRAQTTHARGGNPVLARLLGWYSRHIANRRAGDKLDVGDQYYLWQPAN